jgi:hypothetical protein
MWPLLQSFPYDTVPDGNVFYSHHFVYFAAFALFIGILLIDDEDDHDPWMLLGGLCLSFFAWHYLWPTGKPVFGALLTILGLAIAIGGVLCRPAWSPFMAKHAYRLTRGDRIPDYDYRDTVYGQWTRALLLVTLVGAADDVLEHAFGIWTPLDFVWNAVVADWFPLDPTLLPF